MGMFKMAKQAMEMKSKLNAMEKSLKSNIMEVSGNGVTVKVNGKSEIVDIQITDEAMAAGRENLQKKLVSTVQQAIKKAQDAMAEEAKKITGGMKVPGLM